MTGVILAGGKSTRMGVNKALLEVGGQRLIQRVVDRVVQVVEDIVVVVADEDWVSPELGPGRVRVVADVYPGRGALAGIYSGLLQARTHDGLVVGCDMPFLNVPLLRYLQEVAPGWDVVIPRWNENLEPLHAVYSRHCLEPMERILRLGRSRIIDFFGEVRVRYIGKSETAQFDPQLLSFFNINAPEDLAKAQEIESRGEERR